MKKTLFLLIFAFYAVSSFASQQPINQLDGALVAYKIAEVETGKIITQQNAKMLILPASITKLLTTATALEILGGDYQFCTTIEHDGAVENGILNGNLYIKGSGDPTLGSDFFGEKEFLQQWCSELKKAGITAINGHIVADASAFDDEGFNAKWTWDDAANYYATGTYAISVYDNKLSYTFRTDSAGTTAILVETEPKIDDLTIENRLKAAKTRSDNAYLYGSPLHNVRTIRGTIPCNRNKFVVNGDIPNPPLFLAEKLHKTLIEKGISVSENAVANFFPCEKERKTIFIHRSPELREIVKVVNFESNNHYVEHIFKHLAFAKTGFGTNERAQQVIHDFWETKGFDVQQLKQYDGSGLARANTFSVDFLTKILLYMKNESRWSDDFVASLPLAGKEGTVGKFLKTNKLQGKIRVKSGSMARVQCYSGYISKNGKNYAFTVAINNFLQPRTTVVRAIENWLLLNFE